MPGNDTIDARDGVREQLNCGAGADMAIVDELDVVPLDPGSLCEAVDRRRRPAPRRAEPSLRSSRMRVSKKRIAVKLSWPKGGVTLSCKLSRVQRQGQARAKRAEGDRRLGFLPFAAGKSATVRLKLSARRGAS